MISDKFVLLAAVFNIFGTLSYLRDTLKGRNKPNRVSWFLWALAPMIAFGAEINKGVGLQSLMTFMVGFGPALILMASFVNKRSVWKLTRFDFICGFLSLVGLGLWALTREGNIAILFSIISDGLAALPILRKAYIEPQSESSIAFSMAAIAAFIVLLTIKKWTFAQYGFPAYILAMDILIFCFIKFSPRARRVRA